MNEGDSQTVPLDETYREVVLYSNREFQRYALDHGVYFAPVDDDEIDLLQDIHHIFNMLFDNRLIFPSIPRLRRVLDCGYGSGAWAIDVAVQNPECEVIGIDVYPYPLPADLPANLDFQVDDLNSPSTFPSNYFDLVHSRMMAGGIHANNWMNYLGDILRILRPGGWCQMVEISFSAQSDSGRLTDDHALRVWSQSYMQSVQPAKDPSAPQHLRDWMAQAGFVDIETNMLQLPLSGWPEDARQQAIGTANQATAHRLMSSLAVLPFSQALGMTNAEIQLLIARARNEADNPMYVCIGRKSVSGGGRGSHRHSDSRGHHSSKSTKHGDSRKRARHA
ncbi:S-adenosyl-L-methionine-dependent methyltransferase [Staphylotrichum tortipilum]|uniref:S-adenosyl-L-methionine-dependent methyltransferase n=1 Tax=Staphylotrichum tortipilum TaxID=2831512 RepID=A0AAN6RWM6_9PEZI|nr:S-adenosyl-L-methionine-dependent methyltransferase [Staphylotrichum longicolle]